MGMANLKMDEEAHTDAVNHPLHYNKHPSGVECIDVVEHMGFNLGNAVKYIWRADLKGDALEDLKKARWYLDREIAKRSDERANRPAKPLRRDRSDPEGGIPGRVK